MRRTDKINYYLDIAETVAERGTCLRRNFGAIIVNRDEIISAGYTGAPRGRKNCIDTGFCIRE
ncbi:MAG TPA: cytidine deaminase, partial [Ruminococcaceae bacterium]|nr:cytidine deaminase [Oscillospiraceae bacterium]HBG56118.1 cytidine deaminase [Oscillospiraceae bacterium]HCB91212.1 cytidine deaminase [Oscillospiraceae bacterium]